MGVHTVITHASVQHAPLGSAARVAQLDAGASCVRVCGGCGHVAAIEGPWDESVVVCGACAPSRGVSLGKASDSALTAWERELVHRADAGLSFDLSALPAHAEGLRMNDPITLSSALSIVTGGW